MEPTEERQTPDRDALTSTKKAKGKTQPRPYTQKSIQLSLITLIACVCISALHFMVTNAFPDPHVESTVVRTILTIKHGLVIAVALLAIITVAYWNIASQLEGEPLAIALSHILNIITGALLVLGFLLWKLTGRLT